MEEEEIEINDPFKEFGGSSSKVSTKKNTPVKDDPFLEFQGNLVEKKKPIGTSTSNGQKSALAQTTGSADSVNGMKIFKGLTPEEQKTIRTGNKPVPKINKVLKNKIQETQLAKELANTKVTPKNQDEISAKTDKLSALRKETDSLIDENKLNNVKRIEKDFYPAVGTPDTYREEAEQRYNDAVQQNGVWNNIKALSKQGYNALVGGVASLTDEGGINDLKISTDPLDDKKKQVKAEALKNKEKLTDTEINDRAKELFITEQQDNIYTDKANSFLDDLSEEDKDALEINRREKIPHLSKENDQRVRFNDAIVALSKTKITEIQQLEGEIKKMQENKQPIPDEMKNQYLSLNQELKAISERYAKNREYLQKNTKDLGTAQQELDLFKRENSDFKNFFGNIAAGTGELATGLFGAVNLANSFSPNAVDRIRALQGQEIVSDLDKSLSEYRETLRKPVESVESVEGFVNYASDVMANQIPNLVATSTGTGGLATIGASSTGKKFTEMNDEVRDGKANYSPLQMATIPILYGGAEVVSELPTLNILKKGGRVLEAVGKESPDLINKTLSQKTKEFAKEYGLDQLKEHGGEQFTNAMQNVLTGKPIFENAGTVFKDTATLTTLLQTSPHIAGLAVKPFVKNTDLGKLDENSRKIIEFSKQLKNDPYLSETEKTVIQKNIDKATKESSEIMANTIDKIGNMPTKSYEEVLKLNEEAGKLKEQAKEINDGNLPNKEELLKGLAEEYNALHEKRKNIIEGKTTPIELLPLKEQETLKKQAMEDLVTELNPDGTKDMTITNEQVVKRANEIYAESEKNTKQEETAPKPADKTEKSEVNLPSNEVQAEETGEKTEENLPLNEEAKTEEAPTETKPTEEATTKKLEAKIEEKTTEKPAEQPTPTKTTKTVTSLKNAKYDVDIDENGIVTEIRSQKDGRVVSPFSEYKDKKTGKKRLQKNSNWTKIAADAIGEKTEHQVTLEKKEELQKNLEAFEPANEHEAALHALLTGSKVSLESLQKETGNTDSSWATNRFSTKPLPSIEQLSEQIWENNPDLDQREVRNELIDIISKTESTEALQQKFQEVYAENQESIKNKELEAFKNSLSAKDLAMLDSIQAEDDYISELTDEEAIQYFKEQYNVKTYESEQAQQSGETDNGESRQAQTDSVQASEGGTEKSTAEQGKEIDKSFFDRVLDQKEVKPVLDFLDSLKLDTNDLKSTIPFAPQAWNAFIEAIKLSVKAGNTVSKAIQEASKALKANGVSKADIDAMKDYFTQQVNTKENTEVAVLNQRKKGQKALAKAKKKFRAEISDIKKQITDITDSIHKVRDIEQREALKKQRKELQEKLAEQKEEFKAKIAEIRSKNAERKRKKPKKTKVEPTPETEENLSDEEVFDQVNDTFDSSVEQLKNKKLTSEQAKEAYRKYVKAFTDRQFLPKMLLHKTGLDKTKNLIVNSAGASGHAKVVFEEAYDKIYKGLDRKERLWLDKIIQSNRIIAIDTNREQKKLEPVKHPNNINKSKAEIFLKEAEKKLGKEKYDDLVKRSDVYFKTYKDLLTEMQKNGLISKESLDAMDIKYQPRVFLKFITDFNGDFRPEKSSSDINTGKLSGEQIKKMKEGSADNLVLNSEWLLTNSLSARYKAMAMNNINKKFITEEFPKAKERFVELEKDLQEGKKLSKEDARFHKYFKELDSKIIDNPIVGTTESGKPKFKYDKVPNKNFQKAYYYEDGQRKEFFMEKELHDQWHDNIAGIFSQPLKEVLSYASGAALVKTMATGINPTFPIVNTPRDLLFTMAFSDQYSTNLLKAIPQILGDAGKAVKELSKNDSDILQKYIQYGGKMDMLSSQGRLQKTSMVGKVVDKTIDPKARDWFKKAFDKATLHKASEYSEMMFRLGLFQRSIKNQLKELNLKDISEVTDEGLKDDIYNQAVSHAREILDFNQGGAVTKDLESILPYINVAFQGGRVASAAFNKNPIETTAKVLQISATASALPVGLSLMLLSAFKDDEDKDKTAIEIYLHAKEGMSKEKKSRSMSIVLPFKNEEGEHAILNIAKAQELSPVMSLTDNILENFLRRQADKKQKDAKSVLDEALFTFGSNVLPIDPTQGPEGTLTRNPFIKAVMSSATGHDFFRNQPLSADIGKVPREVEGINMKRTEEFYKTIGEKTGWSPVRTKAAVESYVTSPETNPFVGTLYGGLEAAVSDKGMNEIGNNFLKTLGKSTLKRLISYGSDFNRQLAANEALQEKIDEINADKYRKKSEFGQIANDVANKVITQKEANEKLEKLSPEDRKKAKEKIHDRITFKRVDKPLIDIKYEQGNDVKALMLAHYYGNLLDGSPDSKRIIKQMQILKGVWTPATKKEFRKLMEENKKKPTEK